MNFVRLLHPLVAWAITHRVYLHEFCKVVTSGSSGSKLDGVVYLHEFCKVVTSESHHRQLV